MTLRAIPNGGIMSIYVEMIGSIYTEQSHMGDGVVSWLEDIHLLALEHLLIRTSPTVIGASALR